MSIPPSEAKCQHKGCERMGAICFNREQVLASPVIGGWFCRDHRIANGYCPVCGNETVEFYCEFCGCFEEPSDER